MLLSLGLIPLCKSVGDAIAHRTGVPVIGLVLCGLLLLRDWVGERAPAELRRNPPGNPVLMPMRLVELLVRRTGAPYAAYFDGAQSWCRFCSSTSAPRFCRPAPDIVMASDDDVQPVWFGLGVLGMV